MLPANGIIDALHLNDSGAVTINDQYQHQVAQAVQAYQNVRMQQQARQCFDAVLPFKY
jgi:hypothetical protein